MELETVVLSLGGSIIVPREIDLAFLTRFRDIVLGLSHKRFIIICGGGRVCRTYQDAARKAGEVSKDTLDWIGIRATRLNAELVRAVFGKEAYEKVIHDPGEDIKDDSRVIIGAGFEPGSSTDLRAVQLARRFGASEVINMSNIDYVYSADPKKNPGAERFTRITWPEFRMLVGYDWEPGLNMPFDPVASREAEELGLRVIIVGNRIDNLERLLNGKTFDGTLIS